MTSRFPTPLEMAAWPKPNYIDPETKQPVALGLNTVMTFVIVSFVSCRFYSRTRLIKALGLDDWIMLLAAICQVANNVMIIISMDSEYKMGYHMWDIQLILLMGVMKSAQMGMAAQLLTGVVGALTKVSIILTYLRIFPTRLSRWFCWLMLAYTISLGFACFWLVLFQCSPASTYWSIFKYLTTQPKCLNVKAIYYFYTGQNTLSDFLIFLWPAGQLINVKISLRQRLTLIAMFCFGIIICIVGVARVYYTHIYLTDFDTFWNGAILLVVCALESSLAIACGCLPSCKPLLSHIFPSVFGPVTVPTSNANSSHPSASLRSPGSSHQHQRGKFSGSASGASMRSGGATTTRESLSSVGFERRISLREVESDGTPRPQFYHQQHHPGPLHTAAAAWKKNGDAGGQSRGIVKTHAFEVSSQHAASPPPPPPPSRNDGSSRNDVEMRVAMQVPPPPPPKAFRQHSRVSVGRLMRGRVELHDQHQLREREQRLQGREQRIAGGAGNVGEERNARYWRNTSGSEELIILQGAAGARGARGFDEWEVDGDADGGRDREYRPWRWV